MAENFNPLVDTRQRLLKQRRTVNSKIRRVEKALESARTFDEAAAERRISKLEDECQAAEARHACLSERAANSSRAWSDAEAELGQARKQARVGWDFWNVFSKEKFEARQRVEQKRATLGRRSEQMGQAGAQASQARALHKSLKKELENAKKELRKYRQHPIAAQKSELRSLQAQLAELDIAIDDVTERRKMVDRAIKPLLAELKDAESSVRSLGVDESKLEEEISSLERHVRRANRLNDDLSHADNSYERKLIHEECEREFGVGSPSKAARDLRERKRSVEQDLWKVQKQYRQGKRDVDKLRERIHSEAEGASRLVSAVVIDGMNLCFEESRFVGLRILRALVPLLSPRYEVTIVFDSGIRHRLHLSGEQGIKDHLRPANVFILRSNDKADETILDLAHGEFTWVISNDRFGDFPDKEAVRRRRLIAPKIIDGRILIHELEVDTTY